jgi:cobalt-zinc-cadmium efflux system membrane fusion protein
MKIGRIQLLIMVVVLLLTGIAAVMGIRYRSAEKKSGQEAHKKAPHNEEQEAIKINAEEIKSLGLEVKEAGSGVLALHLELPGEIVANPDRLIHVVSRVPGVIRTVRRNLGDNVRSGEVLAVLDSRELADAKAGYLAMVKRLEMAETNLKREEVLWKKKISAEVDYLEAKKVFTETEIELKSAEQKLHSLGLSEAALESLPMQRDVSFTQHEIRAPLSGTIIEKHMVQGEAIKDDKEVFLIADLTSVWVNINVYQKDLPGVRKGQPVLVSAGGGIPDVQGTIAFVEPVASTETRTALAHVLLPNPKGLLRPGLFVTAKIKTDEISVPILIPKTALVSQGDRTEIFIETDKGFVSQNVSIGRSNGSLVEVVSGLKAGQRYVAQGAFTLKAQMSRGAFGDSHGH